MTRTPSFDALQEEWRRVVAHAWKNPSFLEKLRKDPKGTLEDAKIREELDLEMLECNYLPIPEISDAEGLPPDADESAIIEYLSDEQNGTRLFGDMRMSCI